MERTIVMLKPDCIMRGLVGEIISRFEKKGLKIVGMKMMKLKKPVFDMLYAHHKGKPFYDQLIKFMRKTPVVAVVLEGVNAVEVVMRMSGVTMGREAAVGTIRGDYSMSLPYNIIHVSDSKAMAEKELSLLFKPKEVYDYKSVLGPVMYSEEELAIKPEALQKPRKIPGKEDEPF